MQEFERASFHKEFVDEENNTGSYVFEPLERGFGTTVGSTIKNTMLSNLPGCAVIGFKIEGCTKDQTVIKGILEDVNTLSLNLKALKISCESEGIKALHISKKDQQLFRQLILFVLKRLKSWILNK